MSGGNSRFKIATLSRLPIAQSKVHTEGFHHGAIETEIETPNGLIDIWNTHLFPFNEDGRIAEVEYITSHTDTAKQTLVVGDFNSLSEVDEYPEVLHALIARKPMAKARINLVSIAIDMT